MDAFAQLSVKCKYCGFIAISGGDHTEDSPVLEVDFRDGVLRYICKKCKKDNCLRLVPLDTKVLPKIRPSNY